MSLGDPVPKKLKLFQLGWTRWQPDWKIEITSDNFSSLTSRWIFKLFHRNVSWLFLYQNCSNCSAGMNKMAARGKNRKTFNWLLHINQWMDFEIISQDCFLSDPYSKLLKPFCLDEKMAARAKKNPKKPLNNFYSLTSWWILKWFHRNVVLDDYQSHIVIVMKLCTDFMFLCFSTIIKSCRRNSFLCFTAFITCIHLSMASLPIFHNPLGYLLIWSSWISVRMFPLIISRSDTVSAMIFRFLFLQKS